MCVSGNIVTIMDGALQSPIRCRMWGQSPLMILCTTLAFGTQHALLPLWIILILCRCKGPQWGKHHSHLSYCRMISALFQGSLFCSRHLCFCCGFLGNFKLCGPGSKLEALCVAVVQGVRKLIVWWPSPKGARAKVSLELSTATAVCDFHYYPVLHHRHHSPAAPFSMAAPCPKPAAQITAHKFGLDT